MKKSLAALALAGSVILTGSAPAMALAPKTSTTPSPAASDSYLGTTSDGFVTRGTVPPGKTFRFFLRGFQPFEFVTLTVTITPTPQSLGGSFSGAASMAVPTKITLPLATTLTFTGQANAEGNLAIPVTLDEIGTYTLTAVGNSSGKTVTMSVTVDPDAPDFVDDGGDFVGDDFGFVDFDNDGNNTDGDNTDGNNDGTDGDNTDGTNTGTDGDNTDGTNTGTDGDNTDGTGNDGTLNVNNSAPKAPAADTTANPGPALADTGADTSLMLWSLVGAGALAAGVTSVVVVRRRAKADTTS